MGAGAGGEVRAGPGRMDADGDLGWWGDWVGSRDVDPALSLAVAGSGAASGPGRPCSPPVSRDPGIFGLSRPALCDPGQSEAGETFKGSRPPGCGSTRTAADTGPTHHEGSGMGQGGRMPRMAGASSDSNAINACGAGRASKAGRDCSVREALAAPDNWWRLGKARWSSLWARASRTWCTHTEHVRGNARILQDVLQASDARGEHRIETGPKPIVPEAAHIRSRQAVTLDTESSYP